MPPNNTPDGEEYDAERARVWARTRLFGTAAPLGPVDRTEEIAREMARLFGTAVPVEPSGSPENESLQPQNQPRRQLPVSSSRSSTNPEAPNEPHTQESPHDSLASRSSSQLEYHRTAEECEVPWPIDWQALDYVAKVDDNLLCSICRTPFDLPVSTCPCDHTFCRPCLDLYLDMIIRGPHQNHERPCPICRTPLDLSTWAPGNGTSPAEHVTRPCGRVLVTMLDHLEVKCPNNSQLCTWTGPRSTLVHHIRSNCRFTKAHCVVRSCDKLISRGSQGPECQHYDTVCNYCNGEIVKADQYEHLMLDCPTYIEKCDTCHERVPRDQLATHQETCWDETAECTYTSEGCLIQAKRCDLREHEARCIYGKLSQLQDRLMQRIDAAESVVHQNARLSQQVQQIWSQLQDTQTKLDTLETEHQMLVAEHEALKTAVAEQREKQAMSSFDLGGPGGTAAGGLLAELDTRNSEVLQYLHDQGARQFVMLQNRFKPLEESQHDVNGRLGSLEMQVRWLRSIGRLQQRQNNFSSGINAASRASSENSTGRDGGTGEASSAAGAAAERRLSDQIDRARM